MVASGHYLVGSFLFTSALLFKQIALYYAPAFFFMILGQCFADGAVSGVWRVGVTGVVVLTTVGLLFLPWLLSEDPLASCLQVLHRMFPFARGLYEDKVANVWCSLSVVLKLHKFMSREAILRLCTLTTLAALAPSCIRCCRRRTGSNFVLALVGSSLSFFLFSFQVHEKGVLFPCIPVALLPIALGPEGRPSWWVAVSLHAVLVSMLSMYPLVVKDQLGVVYVGLCLPLAAVCELSPAPTMVRALIRGSWIVGLVLHGVILFVPPPPRLPDLWTLALTSFCCANFVVAHLAVTFGLGLQKTKRD
eukprot:Hpha_TRINITY_DN11641_c0_g1::TRINITY_DN11641_c0_g1_i1::g.48971::m.48971/K03848/ALG6; alpha-1,3-glucosyltransferase